MRTTVKCQLRLEKRKNCRKCKVLSATNHNRMSGVISSSKLTRLQLMLTLLPIPPIPVKFSIDISDFSDKTGKNALVIALRALDSGVSGADEVRNSHAIIASLCTFLDWCDWGKQHLMTSRVKKDGATMRLIRKAMDVGGDKPDRSVSEEDAYDVFFDATRDWIESYLPPEVKFTLDKVSSNSVKHEDIIHIGMAHYCQGQGYMYSKKGSALACPTHANIVQQYEDMVKNASMDGDSVDARKLDAEDMRVEHQELAEMYSKHSFAKLLTLCFTRIHRDSLLGFPNAASESEPAKMAQDLLQSAEKMHKVVMKDCGIEDHENKQVVVAHDSTPSDLMLCGTISALVLDDEAKTAEEAATGALIRIIAACVSGIADARYWNSLALNLENYLLAAQSHSKKLSKACDLIDYDALDTLLQPLLASEDSQGGCNQRIKDCMGALKNRPTMDLLDDNLDFDMLSSMRSELGLILKAAAQDFCAVQGRVVNAANKMCRNSELENEKKASAIFFATGLDACDAGERPDRIVEIE